MYVPDVFGWGVDTLVEELKESRFRLRGSLPSAEDD